MCTCSAKEKGQCGLWCTQPYPHPCQERCCWRANVWSVPGLTLAWRWPWLSTTARSQLGHSNCRQVKRTKQILSANSEAPISVEELFEDHDFRATITRDKFEELAGERSSSSYLPPMLGSQGRCSWVNLWASTCCGYGGSPCRTKIMEADEAVT